MPQLNEHFIVILDCYRSRSITADHGELFGEDGFFGHGPIQHSKVYEVPFVEGKLR